MAKETENLEREQAVQRAIIKGFSFLLLLSSRSTEVAVLAILALAQGSNALSAVQDHFNGKNT